MPARSRSWASEAYAIFLSREKTRISTVAVWAPTMEKPQTNGPKGSSAERCAASTKTGQPCKLRPRAGQSYCHVHASTAANSSVPRSEVPRPPNPAKTPIIARPFAGSIKKVLGQVHDSAINADTVEFIELLLVETAGRVLAEAHRLRGKAVTLQSRDVQKAIRAVLPGELAKHAVSEATKATTKFQLALGPEAAKGLSKNSRAGLVFSVSRAQSLAETSKPPGRRIASGVAIYLAAVLEYLCAELLELGGNAARDHKKVRISVDHVKLAIDNDEELKSLFSAAPSGRPAPEPPMTPQKLCAEAAGDPDLAAVKKAARRLVEEIDAGAGSLADSDRDWRAVDHLFLVGFGPGPFRPRSIAKNESDAAVQKVLEALSAAKRALAAQQAADLGIRPAHVFGTLGLAPDLLAKLHAYVRLLRCKGSNASGTDCGRRAAHGEYLCSPHLKKLKEARFASIEGAQELAVLNPNPLVVFAEMDQRLRQAYDRTALEDGPSFLGLPLELVAEILVMADNPYCMGVSRTMTFVVYSLLLDAVAKAADIQGPDPRLNKGVPLTVVERGTRPKLVVGPDLAKRFFIVDRIPFLHGLVLGKKRRSSDEYMQQIWTAAICGGLGSTRKAIQDHDLYLAGGPRRMGFGFQPQFVIDRWRAAGPDRGPDEARLDVLKTREAFRDPVVEMVLLKTQRDRQGSRLVSPPPVMRVAVASWLYTNEFFALYSWLEASPDKTDLLRAYQRIVFDPLGISGPASAWPATNGSISTFRVSGTALMHDFGGGGGPWGPCIEIPKAFRHALS